MTDAEKYTRALEAFMAKIEERELDRRRDELHQQIKALRRRILAVKPPLTLVDMENIINSAYGLTEVQQIIWGRENAED